MGKLVVRVLLGLVGLVVLAVLGFYAYFFMLLPRDLPVPDLTIEVTPARVERGAYLANAVFGCVYCHSERDWDLFGGPPKPGTIGRGGERFDQSSGVSGLLISPNITPWHLGDWSDGEIYRAIVNGLHKDGYALFPIMPWFMYRYMSDEDAAAVIAYMRAQPPVESFRPDRRLNFPLNIIFRFYPEPLDGPVATPSSTDTVAYGEYLGKISRCEFCHTARVRGQLEPVADRLYSGGVPFTMGTRTQYSMNLTPHETGLGNWTKEQFIGRFRLHTEPFPVAEEDNSEMDWVAFSGMSDEDLGALWDYLQKLRPLETVLLDRAD